LLFEPRGADRLALLAVLSARAAASRRARVFDTAEAAFLALLGFFGRRRAGVAAIAGMLYLLAARTAAPAS